MDVAFLSGDGDEAGDRNGRTRRAGKHIFDRRSEAIAHGSPYQKAAALVDLVCYLSFPFGLVLRC